MSHVRLATRKHCPANHEGDRIGWDGLWHLRREHKDCDHPTAYPVEVQVGSLPQRHPSVIQDSAVL